MRDQIISDERLAEIAEDGFLQHGDSKAMAAELLALRKTSSQPMQPLVTDKHGVVRFKPNAIVNALLDHSTPIGMSMNDIAMLDVSDEDRMQFAQLIGYSLSGYGSLSYVSDESYEQAASLEPISEE